MLSLYHSPFSVSSQKVRIALAEKNLTWEDHIIDLLNGDQFNPEFIALNARAEVPVLVHGNAVLTESSAINEYIDEVFPENRLTPEDPVVRHNMRRAVAQIDALAHQAAGILTYAVLARPLLQQMSADKIEVMFSQIRDPQGSAWKRSVFEHGLEAPEAVQALAIYRQFFDYLEHSLPSQLSWLSGSDFSLADIAAFPYVMRADHMGLGDLFPVHEYPKLRSWYMRTMSRPSMQASFVRYVDEITQELLMQLVIQAAPKLSEMMQPA